MVQCSRHVIPPVVQGRPHRPAGARSRHRAQGPAVSSADLLAARPQPLELGPRGGGPPLAVPSRSAPPAYSSDPGPAGRRYWPAVSPRTARYHAGSPRRFGDPARDASINAMVARYPSAGRRRGAGSKHTRQLEGGLAVIKEARPKARERGVRLGEDRGLSSDAKIPESPSRHRLPGAPNLRSPRRAPKVLCVADLREGRLRAGASHGRRAGPSSQGRTGSMCRKAYSATSGHGTQPGSPTWCQAGPCQPR